MDDLIQQYVCGSRTHSGATDLVTELCVNEEYPESCSPNPYDPMCQIYSLCESICQPEDDITWSQEGLIMRLSTVTRASNTGGALPPPFTAPRGLWEQYHQCTRYDFRRMFEVQHVF
jgi:hypothetical protein